MSKIITIKLTKVGDYTNTFSISDDLGNVLGTNIRRDKLIDGIQFTVGDTVQVISVFPSDNTCCGEVIEVPISSKSIFQAAGSVTKKSNTASLWRHLTNPTLYNNFYGCIHPYIIEYPFAYQYFDEIVQNVKDYTKVYTYFPSINGVFDSNRKIEVNTRYFNKAVLYNGQQSTGILNLEAKPLHNLKAYMSYPKLNDDSKTITFTKSDNFYQYNTFWSVVKDRTAPLFTIDCGSLSLDKSVNQVNMDYTARSFKKEPLRAKDLKIRHILDNASDIHLVSQFIFAPAQNSYK